MRRLIRQLKNLFHLFEAVIACIYYGFPSRSIKVIGVTGTDGKTTTANLIYHILKSSNQKVSLISTVPTIIHNKNYDIGFHTTTPNPFVIQKLLKKAVDWGDQYFVLETSSHAIDQNRIYGIDYKISVLTNVTHEHMDYHPTFNNYLLTKAKLLLQSQISIINKDDGSFEKIKSVLGSHGKKYYTYSLRQRADFQIDLRKKLNRDFEEFNAYNYLAAYSVSKELGLDDDVIYETLKTFRLPQGRMDLVYDKNFKIIIDFANTPNAIKNVLLAVREKYLKNQGRIIHVFGTPGRRDKIKRPFMGKESARYADHIILTGDDYRDEDPKKISEEITSGMEKKDKLISITVDRKQAIKKAIELAKKDDVVIITGIGHQKSLAQGNKEIPWDEEKAVAELVNK